MQNFPLSETGSKQGKSKAEDISERSKRLGVVEGSQELNPSSSGTSRAATTAKPLKKTLRHLDFPAFRLQASLMAGSIGEWVIVEGMRAKTETVLLAQPNGQKYKAIRIFLAIDQADLEVVESPDGVDFAVNGERLKVVE